jgi:hypothetical protein
MDTDTVTYTISGAGNLKFLEAFGVGVSGGFSAAKATARARAFQIKLDDGVCGYFTFVPVGKYVWYVQAHSHISLSHNQLT